MYTVPEQFTIPEAVAEFDKDLAALGMINDSENWYVTPELSEKFRKHAEALRVLAAAGDPWAQYRLGNIYFSGVLYSSEEEFITAYETDAMEGSRWLEKASRQGFVAAVDNLVVIGVGPEAERLRAISRAVENERPDCIQPLPRDPNVPVIYPEFFEAVWQTAYGYDS